MVAVPWARFIFAGFPCKSKSKANHQRGEHAKCIEEGTGVTGMGCQDLLAVIRRALPEVVVLENVPELADGGPGETDMDTIAKWFSELDYWLWWHVFDATDHGSLAVRQRVYSIALTTLQVLVQPRLPGPHRNPHAQAALHIQ